MAMQWPFVLVMAAASTAGASKAAAGQTVLRGGARGTVKTGDLMQPYCRYPDNSTGGVTVWIDTTINERSLSFGQDDLVVQSSVRCKGAVPAECHLNATKTPPDCAEVPSCPCEAKTDARDFPILRTMMDELEPICRRSGDMGGGLRLLLIGLGGGTVPAFLEHHCPKGSLHVDSIEYNQHVIDAATGFFGLRVGDAAGVSVEQDDGLAAVQRRLGSGSGTYDAAIVDCFGANERVPAPCASLDLAKGLATLLKPSGLAFQNLDLEPPDSILANFRQAFGEESAKAVSMGVGQHLLRAQKKGHLYIMS